jgi:uncharacterized protein YbgA (DUF1722 family)/uncharacterized protein YbbK (DUF523 family)
MAQVARPAAGRTPWQEDAAIKIGVSACLLGQEVRFDGGHKRNGFLADTLGAFVEFVPVCPEFDLGLGVPRESLRLERRGSGVHLIAHKSGADHTAPMTAYAAKRTAALAHDDLCGYVLKKDSPSCGMERVRVYGISGMPARDGVGLFAAALITQFPNLPVEEEGRLSDAHLRENFVERVFAYRRLRSFFSSRWTVGGLVRFHTAHKLLVMAHSPEAYRELGRIVAGARRRQREPLRAEYESLLMRALAKIASPSRHANVMQHMMGYLRPHLDAQGRSEIGQLVEDYRGGLVPLVVPITMFRHYVAKFGIEYLQGQVYLEPHPKELMLRNHV